MPNWSEPKIAKEKVKIEPEVFLEDARKYANSGDFNMAEKAYVNALSNARGASNIKEIISIVKEGLSEIYKLWTQECIKQYEYQDAEPILQKMLKISDDKQAVQEEFIELYNAWGLSLFRYDNNVKGAIIIFAKKLKLEKKLEQNTEDTETELTSFLYSSKNKKYRKIADGLYFRKKEARVRLLLSALIMAGVALATPLFAPYSIDVYIFSYFMFVLRHDWLMSGLKKLRECLALTFFSLIWMIILTVFGITNTAMSIITFVILVFISIRVMLCALSQFKVYFSYKKKDVLEAIEYILVPVNISCKSCSAKLKIPGETISTIKCSKCGKIVREAMDPRIKNKPVVSTIQTKSGEYDSKAAWGRIGFHAGRFIFREILKNIRL